MIQLRPGIWFVYRNHGVGRYNGSYPVTWQGWWVTVGLVGGIFLLSTIFTVIALLRPESETGYWIGGLTVIVFGIGLAGHPYIRRHTDYSITLLDWRAAQERERGGT